MLAGSGFVGPRRVGGVHLKRALVPGRGTQPTAEVCQMLAGSGFVGPRRVGGVHLPAPGLLPRLWGCVRRHSGFGVDQQRAPGRSLRPAPLPAPGLLPRLWGCVRRHSGFGVDQQRAPGRSLRPRHRSVEAHSSAAALLPAPLHGLLGKLREWAHDAADRAIGLLKRTHQRLHCSLPRFMACWGSCVSGPMTGRSHTPT